MSNKLIFPAPWFVWVSTANFGLLITMLPVPVLMALIDARQRLLPRQEDQLLTQLYFDGGISMIGFGFAGFYFLRKALFVRKFGLDISQAAKAPRMLRFSAWLTVVSLGVMLIFYCAVFKSVYMWLAFVYLMTTVAGIAFSADFAARSAYDSSRHPEENSG